MAVGKIRIYVDLRDHVILCAQCAKSAFIIGLDRSVRCPITVDFSGQRGFGWSDGARGMEHFIILRVFIRSYGGRRKTYVK